MVNAISFSKLYARVAGLAALLGLVVVMLGAYTRLMDAGLGCPDWPGCYGQLLGVPHSSQELTQAANHFPQVPVVEAKAWPEMIHRYVAGTLSLFIVGLSLASFWRRRSQAVPGVGVNLALLAVLAAQVVLGIWTVTMKLHPLVIMSHLMGGMVITVLLWVLSLLHRRCWRELPEPASLPCRWQLGLLIGLVLIVVQILLGGWTSANYASIICTDFPTCRGSWWPASLDFRAAFDLLAPLGYNYQGGVLGDGARMAIQLMHRYWGALTACYLLGASGLLLGSKRVHRCTKFLALVALGVMVAQVLLGVFNVLKLLPLSIAVMHNGGALLLLMVWVTLLLHSFEAPGP